MARIAIIGTTSWGTTLGVILAWKGMTVRLWARTEGEAAHLGQTRENDAFLPGVRFPARLSVTASMSRALRQAEMVILAVPSQSLRSNVRMAAPYLKDSTIILSVTKGIELGSLLRMSEVIAQEVPPALRRNICVMSGPNLSAEIVRRLPAATVVSSHDEQTMARAQELMTCPHLRVYTNADMIGVELGGALKNIIALGAGIADGMDLGDNGKAMFMTRGLAEIARLGMAAGASPLTFAGLAGLGDLIVTCSSRLSRNHQAGLELARGVPLEQITSSVRTVAEGIPTTMAACQLADRLGVEMPLTRTIFRVLFDGMDPRRALGELMGRTPGDEMASILRVSQKTIARH